MRNLNLQKNVEQINELVSLVVSTNQTEPLLDLVSCLFPIFKELYKQYATFKSDELEWINIAVGICYEACYSFSKVANISFPRYYESLLRQQFLILLKKEM